MRAGAARLKQSTVHGLRLSSASRVKAQTGVGRFRPRVTAFYPRKISSLQSTLHIRLLKSANGGKKRLENTPGRLKLYTVDSLRYTLDCLTCPKVATDAPYRSGQR